jgi:glucose-6-phosphate 1-dehydrogenase
MQGQYDSEADFGKLDERMAAMEAALPRGDRIFYLSIPPNLFTAVARSASKAASSK